MAAWDDFEGSDAEGMAAGKLRGRLTEVRWQPPKLTFVIDRHGGTVHGSTRAERHQWVVALDAGTAFCRRIGHRQLKPAAPRLNVAPLADEVASLILAGRKDERLAWKADGTVRVHIGFIIPDSGFPETVAGRRRRFREALHDRVRPAGWTRDDHGTYHPPSGAG